MWLATMDDQPARPPVLLLLRPLAGLSRRLAAVYLGPKPAWRPVGLSPGAWAQGLPLFHSQTARASERERGPAPSRRQCRYAPGATAASSFGPRASPLFRGLARVIQAKSHLAPAMAGLTRHWARWRDKQYCLTGLSIPRPLARPLNPRGSGLVGAIVRGYVRTSFGAHAHASPA